MLKLSGLYSTPQKLKGPNSSTLMTTSTVDQTASLIAAFKSPEVQAVLATAFTEASKVTTPLIAQQSASLCAEKTAAVLSDQLLQLSIEVKILKDRMEAMATAPKKAPAKKAAETAPAATGAPGAAQPATADAPIKTPLPADGPKAYGNRQQYLKFCAKSTPEVYKRCIPEAVILKARESPQYLAHAAKISAGTAGADAQAVLVGYEAAAAYAIISKETEHAVAFAAVTAAMKDYNASLAAPPKIEKVEQLD